MNTLAGQARVFCTIWRFYPYNIGFRRSGGIMAKKKGIRLIANNKKAYHDYFIEETWEAGIALAGTEVKSSEWANAA